VLWRSLDPWIWCTSVVGRVPVVCAPDRVCVYCARPVGRITVVSCLRLFTYRVRCALARFLCKLESSGLEPYCVLEKKNCPKKFARILTHNRRASYPCQSFQTHMDGEMTRQ
jgi:hypothetical protein